MPKYYEFKVCGYYLYYTASCVVEAMHVHASDKRMTEAGSAKFFVKSNGDTTVEKQGKLTDREVRKIRVFIKKIIKKCISSGRKLLIQDFMVKNNIILLSTTGDKYRNCRW